MRLGRKQPEAAEVSGETQGIIDLWKTREGADWAYFDAAEDESWSTHFWSDGTLFREFFDRLDLTSVVEIACGAGRHASRFAERAGQVYLADTSVDALAEAKKRFAGQPNVKILPPGDGMHVPLKGSELATSVISYDAMVHFELECVASYISESARLLKPGGMALIHHSNYSANPGGEIAENPDWRNFMTRDLFAHFAKRDGFEIIEQREMDWTTPKSDCLSLLRKPS